jgi:UDP-3-O-[3-hydroxymyristoyl] N-acetylglucosamine deacetylase
MSGDIEPAAQRTLKAAIGCRGVGLHTGRKVFMTLKPAAPGTGILFRRTDVGVDIKANWKNAIESPLCTLIGNGRGTEVGTIEHLMAALAGAEIDNAIVELDGPEVPIMDGSAAPFLFLIKRVGVREQERMRRAIRVLKAVSVVENGAAASLTPASGFSMSFEIEFANPLIRRQEITLALEEGAFERELARARTFGLVDDLDRLRAAGLVRGGSLENAVVVSGDQVLNSGGLRYADEFVRHKLLDALGDLYLAGGPIIGHFRGVRSGHALTRRLLARLFADGKAWSLTTIARMGGPDSPEWSEEALRARA